MNISDLASKPKLIPIKIEDKDIVEKYGDALEFWVYDRQPLDTFAKLASAKEDNMEGVTSVITDLILDSKGNKVIVDDKVLPMDVMAKCMSKITEELGK